MKEIRLIIRSRERNTESTEMDYNLKQIENKFNELIGWINGQAGKKIE